MTKDEIQGIIEDIEKSGLPCEVETTKKFTSAKWWVINQSAYIDEDTNELRHIDLIASKFIKPALTEIVLVIECCRSEKPWAFYGVEQTENTVPSVCPPHLPRDISTDRDLAIFLDTTLCSHHGQKRVFEGEIPYEPFTKGRCVNILDASMKSIKALRFDLKEKEQSDRKFKKNTLGIFYPVIVFDGHLYSLTMQNGKVVPVRKDYLRYLMNYRKESYLIDIVTKSSLTDYISLLAKEIRRIQFHCRKWKLSKRSQV